MPSLAATINAGSEEFTQQDNLNIRKNLIQNKNYEIIPNVIAVRNFGEYRKDTLPRLGMKRGDVNIYFASNWEIIIHNDDEQYVKEMLKTIMDDIKKIIRSKKLEITGMYVIFPFLGTEK